MKKEKDEPELTSGIEELIQEMDELIKKRKQYILQINMQREGKCKINFAKKQIFIKQAPLEYLIRNVMPELTATRIPTLYLFHLYLILARLMHIPKREQFSRHQLSRRLKNRLANWKLSRAHVVLRPRAGWDSNNAQKVFNKYNSKLPGSKQLEYSKEYADGKTIYSTFRRMNQHSY